MPPRMRPVSASGQLCIAVMMGRNPASTSRSTPSMQRAKVPSPRMASFISGVTPSRLTRSSREYGDPAASRASSRTVRSGRRVALVSTVAGPSSSVSSRMPHIS